MNRLKATNKGWKLDFQVSGSLKMGYIHVVYHRIHWYMGGNVEIQEYKVETRNAGFEGPKNGLYNSHIQVSDDGIQWYTLNVYTEFSKAKKGPKPKIQFWQVEERSNGLKSLNLRLAYFLELGQVLVHRSLREPLDSRQAVTKRHQPRSGDPKGPDINHPLRKG